MDICCRLVEIYTDRSTKFKHNNVLCLRQDIILLLSSAILTFACTVYLVILIIRGEEVAPVCVLHAAHTAYPVPPLAALPPVWAVGFSQTASAAGSTDV